MRPLSRVRWASRACLLATLLLSVLGCATVARQRAAVAVDGAGTAPRIRESFSRFALARAGDDLQVLVLSGGGQNGAFGAGVLRGWRERGRPRFDVVSGISTGALQATFAFLGTPEDDAVLEALYTGIARSDVLCMRPALAMPFSTSLADFTPLRRLLERVLDDATIDRVAAASEDGRRLLLVGTTNLDSGRMAVWDLGALARAGDRALYRAVLLAAASPPVLADPVLLGGVPHADGGVLGNVFLPNAETHLAPAALERYHAIASGRAGKAAGLATFHVIYNGLLRAGAVHVELGVVPIATRSLDLLVTSSGHGSLWYLYGLAQRRSNAFRFVRIPEENRAEAEDAFAFDPASMRALFDAGVRRGRDSTPWAAEPPPLEEDQEVPTR